MSLQWEFLRTHVSVSPWYMSTQNCWVTENLYFQACEMSCFWPKVTVIHGPASSYGRQYGLKIALKIERYGPAVPILGIQVWELLFIHFLPNKEQGLSIQLIVPPWLRWDSGFLIPSKYMTESRDYSVGILPSPLQWWECCVSHLPLLQSLHLGNRRFKS